MVAQQTLTLFVWVRALVPQPFLYKDVYNMYLHYFLSSTIVVIILIFIFQNRRLSLENKNLKKKLKYLCEKTGNEQFDIDYVSPELKKQLLDLVKKGDKINAIKLLREEKSMSLKEAKTFVDNLID